MESDMERETEDEISRQEQTEEIKKILQKAHIQLDRIERASLQMPSIIRHTNRNTHSLEIVFEFLMRKVCAH